ncbi:MAG: hypothetical protein KJO00_02905 [Bacteroidia bacterium]|nr:hypothetical protein [Bacteroidia bacterium]NNK70999.1 hypothetical protein [Flavobacteriaceae bacterium]
MKLKTIILSSIIICFSCKTDKKQPIENTEEVNKDETIEIITNAMEFITQDTIPSGWQTFRYINNSPEAHFILFDKYPEGKTIADTRKDIFPPFDKGMELIIEGKMEEAMNAFGELPEWFSEIVFTGGSGLISPNQLNTFTLKLDPGLYILECYVKMANGQFHSSMGMVKEIHVTEESSDHQPPEAMMNVAISSVNGIVINDTIRKGEQTFKVLYEDQIVHENFVGHDLNLARLEDDADLNALEAWMNWANPTGLRTPAPAGVTFLGGTNDAPAGSVQYFTANLTPGNYVLISEVPDPSKKGMLKRFRITEK